MVNMNNILNAITGADKSMREDMAANAGLLDRKQFNQFVREIDINSTILKDAAFRRMERMNEVLSGAYIEGRVLQDGYLPDGTTNGNLEKAEIGFGKAELSAKKLCTYLIPFSPFIIFIYFEHASAKLWLSRINLNNFNISILTSKKLMSKIYSIISSILFFNKVSNNVFLSNI